MKIGILQGRLSPSPDGRFQFFPPDWTAEFAIAKELGIAGIEWICDTPEMEAGSNPFLSYEKRINIGRTVRTTGVPVTSICADWYMAYDLRTAVHAKLDWLLPVLDAATDTTERRVLIPLLEKNAPRTLLEKAQIIENLKTILPALNKLWVTVAFETEMPADQLAEFVDAFSSPFVGVYYDIGNCTSYGFDCPKDILTLGTRVKGVHVKDRKIGSTQSVSLGAGDANIAGCVKALAKVGWDGTLIMQAWRTPTTYLQDAREQLAYLQKILKEV